MRCRLSASSQLVARSAADETWHLLIEPTFMHYEVELADRRRRENGSGAGALRQRRSASLEDATKLLTLRRDSRQDSRVRAQSCLRGARRRSSPASFATKTTSFNAPCSSPTSPLTASAVLAPEFATLFSDTLGPDILVAIPNRFRIFVFPKGSPAFQRFSEIVIAEYDSSSYPVSKELFSVRKGKLIAIGSYR